MHRRVPFVALVPMRRRALSVACFVAVAALLMAGAADAHPRAAGVDAPLDAATVTSAPPVTASAPVPLEMLRAGASEAGVPWVALLLIAAIGAAALSRRRRVVAVTLVAIVALLAFEAGVHSTHHLDTPDDAAQCVVASTSAQLAADVVDATPDVPALLPLPDAPVVTGAASVARSIAPDRGRAPPALSI